MNILLGIGHSKEIQDISYSYGRLGILISGRVFIFCCEKLFKTDPEVQESLILVGTRKSQPFVDNFYLGPNYLVTVGGNVVVLFDFWNNNNSMQSEFFK